MRMSRGKTALIAGAIVLGGITLSAASTFLKVDVPTLKRMSEAVVQADVVDVRSAWNEEGSAIFTYVTLQVMGRLHGASTDQVVVRVPGGTVGDFTSEMEGAPVFHEGDHVVAFIGRWFDGVPMVAGYAQGLSRINRDRLGNLMLEGGVADGMPLAELGKQLARAGN
ncbi:MAG TPA: hypothetical protein VFV19_16955 [Candidatus Polarisedimenticolaceae bacterium]|nr:hypothetical protein [Candidatus Polarisedimenticolaceae bacterium]